jgi:hypothetical protein
MCRYAAVMRSVLSDLVCRKLCSCFLISILYFMLLPFYFVLAHLFLSFVR